MLNIVVVVAAFNATQLLCLLNDRPKLARNTLQIIIMKWHTIHINVVLLLLAVGT